VTCAQFPCVWGYNDCQNCLNEQHRQQLKGLAEDLDYDFSDPALPDPHEHDIAKAQDIILVLMRMFEGRVSTRRDLNDATDMFLMLEKLRINRSSDAWGEVLRLKRIWKKRIDAEEGIDNWCTSHGYAAY
jgi:hypothetical protein